MEQPAEKRIKLEGSTNTSASSSNQHGHLAFLHHGEGKKSLANTILGSPSTSSSSSVIVNNKTPIVMQAELVSYLMTLASGNQASPMDILRELGIDLLDKHSHVLDLVKYNPKVLYIEKEQQDESFENELNDKKVEDVYQGGEGKPPPFHLK